MQKRPDFTVSSQEKKNNMTIRVALCGLLFGLYCFLIRGSINAFRRTHVQRCRRSDRHSKSAATSAGTSGFRKTPLPRNRSWPTGLAAVSQPRQHHRIRESERHSLRSGGGESTVSATGNRTLSPRTLTTQTRRYRTMAYDGDRDSPENSATEGDSVSV